MSEHQDETRAAYDAVVELYASMFANRLETQPFSRNMIGTFAELVRDGESADSRRRVRAWTSDGDAARIGAGRLRARSFPGHGRPRPAGPSGAAVRSGADYSWPVDQFAKLLTGAGLVTFARLLHDPASERGFLDAHLLARRP